MSALGNKRDHLRRAKELIATGSAVNLRYAALELRMCLEAMTYEKARTFEKYLPASVLEKWQPAQLLKVMMQFDQYADQTFQLLVGSQSAPGEVADPASMQLVGEHKAFGFAWLRTNHHKLGSLLHAQRKGQGMGEPASREYLELMASRIEEAQTGLIVGATFFEPARFACEICKAEVTFSRHYAEATGRAVCLNPDCEAEYFVKSQGGQFEYRLRGLQLPCKGCGETIGVLLQAVRPGATIQCPKCEQRHQIGWALMPTEESAEQRGE